MSRVYRATLFLNRSIIAVCISMDPPDKKGDVMAIERSTQKKRTVQGARPLGNEQIYSFESMFNICFSAGVPMA